MTALTSVCNAADSLFISFSSLRLHAPYETEFVSFRACHTPHTPHTHSRVKRCAQIKCQLLM